ncbi:hypothetical protein Psal182_01700 [Piscirickettsia salmonis]|nr:hypothetical protein Psal182_01700 [Piscirickettsia salmonis]
MECADSRHATLCDADSRGFIVVAFCSAILHHWMCKIPTEVATLTNVLMVYNPAGQLFPEFFYVNEDAVLKISEFLELGHKIKVVTNKSYSNEKVNEILSPLGLSFQGSNYFNQSAIKQVGSKADFIDALLNDGCSMLIDDCPEEQPKSNILYTQISPNQKFPRLVHMNLLQLAMVKSMRLDYNEAWKNVVGDSLALRALGAVATPFFDASSMSSQAEQHPARDFS